MSIVGILLIISSAVITGILASSDLRRFTPLGLIGMVVGVFLTIIAIVPRGTVGVEMQFGAVTGGYRTQGLQFKSPVVKLQIVNVQTQKEEVVATAASKDLQDVSTTIALNYHLNPASAPEVYRDLGLDYIVKIADPAIQETVKQVTARHNAEDLIIRREVIKAEITEELANRLAPRGITVEALSITNFQFSAVFTAAIEAKVSALQAVFEAQNKLERVRVEAQQREAQALGEANAVIKEAEGRARAIQIITDAQVAANKLIVGTLNPEMLQYIFLDRLGKEIKVIVIPQGQNFVLPDLTE